MSNINLNVDVGQTKTLTFNTKDKYNSENIVFNIAANDTLAAWAKAPTKPSYTWSEINDKPTFATVATSGSYNDLTNKPTLSTFGITATAAELNFTEGVTSNIQTQLNNTLKTSHAASNFSGTNFVSGSISQGLHDCNTANSNGHYYFSSRGNGPSPSILGNNSANDGALYVQSYSDSWVGQIAQDYRTGKLFVRGRNNGTWVEWKGIPYFLNKDVGDNNTPVYISNGELKPCETSFATLDSTGKVPTSQLPSYVDDVAEYTNRVSFPATGEKGKIYVDTTENDIYRWTGSTYIKISGIIGAQGEKGTQGYQGLQGTKGTTGLQGTTGSTGIQGKQGLQGAKGLQGATGTTGLQGTKGTDGTRGVQGFQGYQGIKGTDGINGTNFVGCFTSTYSLYERNQYTTGTTYTFNKSNFNFLNAPLSQGDTILVIYSCVYNNVTYVEHCYIRLTRFIEDETTFMGVVWKWFKISDGAAGVQGFQGLQGTKGTDGSRGVQGFQGLQGTTGSRGLQGISGALATNHWYLDKANPEVTSINGVSNIIQLDTYSDSIFAKLSNLNNGSLAGRNFIVDLSDSDGSAMINNLFGDFSKYDVPNHVRYHFYIRNMSKRQNPVKLNWNSEFFTNVPHRDGYVEQIILNYGECCKIEFVKFDQTYSWVDVELEDIIYNTSTAAASENNEDNAASQIQAYCENNKLSYTLDEKSHTVTFNIIDILADICSKIK